ncbi:MAG: carboxynorspermidine decarboxylase, partial [Methylococcaceae bacterium]|nr:carboxynorspermidine decarboxylase [Methylococcaceae bacterium]
GIRADEISKLDELCSHISFNSLNQHQRLSPLLKQASTGLRLNPKISFLDDDRFNPCRQHSKLGVAIEDFCQQDSELEGLHFHTIFSATDFTPLKQTLTAIEKKAGNRLKQLKWLNLGGGYLFNQIKNLTPLIELIQRLQQQYALDVYIEPGKAIVGEAGYLMTSVIDLFNSDGKTVAILDTSINHNPEVFEYQKKPLLCEEDLNGHYHAILAGSTCLAGDIFGEYRFNKALKIGDKLIFKNLGAYSLIKANRFNGYNLPDIYNYRDGNIKKIKQYNYQDYQQQWHTEKTCEVLKTSQV